MMPSSWLGRDTGKTETLRQLARDIGVSRQRIASLLRERGLQLRRATPSAAEVNEMARRYAEGESLERVGTWLGYSAATVRNHLLAEGVVRDCKFNGVTPIQGGT